MRIEKFLDKSPLFNLYVAHDVIMGDVQRRLARENLHFLEALVLTGLFFEERSVRPKELAETFLSSKSNMSHILRSLEKKALIERKMSPEDARAYLFSLTKEGRKRAPRLIKLFDSTQDQIENSPTGKKLNLSLKMFRHLYRHLSFPL